MQYSLGALIYFPDNIVGCPLKELIIDTTKGYIELYGVPLQNTINIPDPILNNTHPEELIRQFAKVENQKQVKVYIKIECSNDSREAWLQGSKLMETFCSWLSFLCLQPFKILAWLDMIGQEGNTVSFSKDPNSPEDTDSSVNISGYDPARNLDLRPWLYYPLTPELSHILRWIRKGMITLHPEEKLIFWVTAMEIVSGALEEQGENEAECPKCGNVFSLGPSANKSGLLKFLRKELNYSRNKIYEPIWKARSKFVHGSTKDFSYKDFKIEVDAAWALVILVTSYFILTKTNAPFPQRATIREKGYNFEHPVFGTMFGFKKALDDLTTK